MRLSCLFSDGMVMQRNKTNFVRGNTDPGIMVKGTFGAQKFQAESDEQGRFEIELPSLPAGENKKQVYLTIAGAYDIVCMGKTI